MPGVVTVLAQPAPPPLDLGPVVLGGVLALLVTLLTWPVSGHLITAAHEGGHALMGSAVGGSVLSVRMNPRRTGETWTLTPAGAAGDLVTFAGYLAPSVFGVLGAILLDDGQVRTLLWVALFFLFLLLLQVNDLFSLFVVVMFGGVVAFVLAEASPGVQTLFAYTWTWFLLLGGLRHTFDQPSDDPGAKRSVIGGDAMILKGTTFLPATLWMAVFWVFAFAALGFGGGILLGLIGQHAAP